MRQQQPVVQDRPEPSRNREKHIRDEWIARVSQLAAAVEGWVDDFKKIPIKLMEESCFRLGTQMGKKQLGLADELVPTDEVIVETLTQAKEDEEEFNPEWIAAIERMMQAYDKKLKIEDDFERPSFELVPESGGNEHMDRFNSDDIGNGRDDARAEGHQGSDDVPEGDRPLSAAGETGPMSDGDGGSKGMDVDTIPSVKIATVNIKKSIHTIVI